MQKALRQQQNEIDDHAIYRSLARIEEVPANREILEKIAAEEMEHYRFWKKITGREMAAR